MKRLDDLRAAINEQLEAVLEGVRILSGIAQRQVAVAAEPTSVRCPFCQQQVTPTATVCLSCRRKLTPATAQ
jgi:hypothetical protein